VSALSCHAGIAGGTLHSTATSDWGGLRISYETFFQSCCKMWICRLGSMHGWCMTVPRDVFFLQFAHSSKTCFRNTVWTNHLAFSAPDLCSLDFYFWGHLLMLQKTMASRTCNEYRMNLRWLVRQPIFSSESGSHCSDVQYPELKLKVDSVSIFFILLDAANSETMLKMAYVYKNCLPCVVV